MNQDFALRSKLVASLFLGTALVLSGCKQSPAPAPGVRNSDGSITNADGSITYPAGTAPTQAAAAPAPSQPRQNADGSITNPDGSVTYPAGSNRAERESRPASSERAEERRSEPRPQQAAPVERVQPAPVQRVIPADTAVRVATNETLSASRNEAGDSFTGTLAGPIEVSGAHFFGRGTAVTGTVAASKRKGRFKGAGDLAIEINTIGGVHVNSTEYEAVAKGEGKRTGALIGGGGGVGALIGGLAGGGKGALIGGLAGAGAGTAASAYTGNRDVIIPAETVITFRLTSAVTLH